MSAARENVDVGHSTVDAIDAWLASKGSTTKMMIYHLREARIREISND